MAIREGLTGTDKYLEQWRCSAKQEREGTAEEVAAGVLGEIEAKY